MAGRLNAIVISPMSHKPMGEEPDEEEKDKPEGGDEEEGGDDECKIAFDAFAEAIGLPESKRADAYDAMHRYFQVEFDKAESEPHEEGPHEEGSGY